MGMALPDVGVGETTMEDTLQQQGFLTAILRTENTPGVGPSGAQAWASLVAPRISLAREPQAPPLGAFAPERLGRGAGAAGAASAAGGASAAGSATATGLGRAAPKEGAAVEAECAYGHNSEPRKRRG